MDAATASLIPSPFLPHEASRNGAGSMFLTASGPGFTSSCSNLQLRQNSLTRFSKPLQTSTTASKTRRSFVVKASSSADEASSKPIAPLQLESPAGQFLSQILVSHPHLVPAAVEQQLEQLQTDRDSQGQNTDSSSSLPGTDIVLYRRIAELKENERRRTLEEILYALVVHISELSSEKFQVQSSSVSPAKTRLTREEKGKAKMFEEDKPQAEASLQSKSDSVASGDQRSLRVHLAKRELDDKTQTKASTDTTFSIKLANAFSALNGVSDTG